MWRWDQGEPFGNDVPNDNPSGAGAFDFPLRFPGQYFDQETNLAYNYFRDYDPSLGRYVESDPIGLEGGSLSTYVYVQSNPLNNVDPSGLTSCDGKWRLLRWSFADHRDPPPLLSRPGRPYGSQCWCYWTCDRCNDGPSEGEEKVLGTMFININRLCYNRRTRTMESCNYPNDCRCEKPGPESKCVCRG